MNTRSAFENLGITHDGGSNGTSLLDLDADDVIASFKSSGFVMLTGFEVDTKAFEVFTNRFSNDYMDHRGGGSLRQVINKDGDKTILSVSYNFKKEKKSFDGEEQETFPLALLSDRSYTNSRPPVMWFYCAIPPKKGKGGETIVCDGVKIYEGLSERTRKLFEEQDIKYIRHYPKGEWQLWAQTDEPASVRDYCDSMGLALKWDTNEGVTTEYTCPAIVTTKWGGHKGFVNSMLLVLWQEEALGMKRSLVRLADGSKIPDETIREIRQVSDSLTNDITWNPGDIAMIDNTRVMHGRRAFTDAGRQIYVRMCRSVDW
jgi:alpha-ketoglutarate-dependent taurine dioxygenase